METVTIQSQLFKFTDTELLVEMRKYNEETIFEKRVKNIKLKKTLQQ